MDDAQKINYVKNPEHEKYSSFKIITSMATPIHWPIDFQQFQISAFGLRYFSLQSRGMLL